MPLCQCMTYEIYFYINGNQVMFQTAYNPKQTLYKSCKIKVLKLKLKLTL